LPEVLDSNDLKHFHCDGEEIIRHFSVKSELTDSVMDCHLFMEVHNDALRLAEGVNVGKGKDKGNGDESQLVIL